MSAHQVVTLTRQSSICTSWSRVFITELCHRKVTTILVVTVHTNIFIQNPYGFVHLGEIIHVGFSVAVEVMYYREIVAFEASHNAFLCVAYLLGIPRVIHRGVRDSINFPRG